MLADDLMNAVFNGTNYTSPTNLYLALFTQAGEVVGGSYQRVEATGKFGASSSGTVQNSVQIVFPKPTLDWGTITRCVLYDSLTGGNELISYPVEQPFSISNGSDVFINAGMLVSGVTI